MNIIFIGRKHLNNLDDVAEEYEIFRGFQKIGHDCGFLTKESATISKAHSVELVFIAKEMVDIKALRECYPNAKIAYWTPDYMLIADTEGNFQRMISQMDCFIGNMRVDQPWFKENKVEYIYWPFDVACYTFQVEHDPSISNYHPQTPYPDVIQIGFVGNWSHNPWRANILREFQYAFRDGVLHVTGASVKEFRERDDLRDVHYALYGNNFNKLIGITKVNLSMESMGNFGYWASRTARIMAAGGFALVWYCDGIEEVLGPDKENVVYFRSAQEGIALARYYLQPEHDRERLAIAKRGNLFVNTHLRTINKAKELDESLRLRLFASQNN